MELEVYSILGPELGPANVDMDIVVSSGTCFDEKKEEADGERSKIVVDKSSENRIEKQWYGGQGRESMRQIVAVVAAGR